MASRKRTDATRAAQARYERAMIKRIVVKLNRNTDADIIEHIEAMESMQGYVKELIRADMTRHEAELFDTN